MSTDETWIVTSGEIPTESDLLEMYRKGIRRVVVMPDHKTHGGAEYALAVRQDELITTGSIKLVHELTFTSVTLDIPAAVEKYVASCMRQGTEGFIGSPLAPEATARMNEEAERIFTEIEKQGKNMLEEENE